MAFYPCGQSHNLSDLAHKATHDSLGQQIDATYIKDIDVDDVFLKLTKGNGTIVTHELEIFATEIMTVPSEMSSLTYTGTEQSPIWRDYDPEQLELSGVVSAIVDGTYTATFTPKSGYKWGDGTGKTPKDINWKINAIVISTKPSLKAELTYSGATQSPVWNNYDSSKLTLSGTTSAIEDGTYTATFTPKTGYAWSDGTKTPYNVTWIINPVVISAIPSASALTYNTAEQSPTWSNYDSLQLTIGGSTAGTNAGTYTTTFTPKTGYAWSDGSKTTKSVNWSIGKAAGSMSLSTTSVTLNADNLTQTVTVTRTGDGAISASSNNTGVATVSVSGNSVTISNVNQTSGSATITVNVAEGTNYYAPSGHTIVVSAMFVSTTLNNNSWDIISQVSAAGTAQNYWNVGDVKYITLNGKVGEDLTLTNQTFGVFILGFDHNASVEGSGISFGTFKTTDGVDVCLNGATTTNKTDGTKIFNMNHYGVNNNGGWKATDIRYDILGSTNIQPQYYGTYKKKTVGYDANATCVTSPISNTLMAALPSDLRAVMKPITKYTDNVAGSAGDVASNVSSSIDYLPLLSEYEVYGARTHANTYEQNYQNQYQYYINGNSTKKYWHDGIASDISLEYWLLRSPYLSNVKSFCAVYGDGTPGSTYIYTPRNVACVFLV